MTFIVLLGLFSGCGAKEADTGEELQPGPGADASCEYETLYAGPGYSGWDWYEDQVITDNETWQSYLAEFTPIIATESMARTEIDFTTEQVAISTHHEASTCGMSFDSAMACEEGGLITLHTVVNDSSHACDTICDAEGQVVFAVVTPAGADIAFEEEIGGGCD